MIDGFLMSAHSISRAPNCPEAKLFGCLSLSACSRTVRIFAPSALKALYTADWLPNTQKLTLGFGSSYIRNLSTHFSGCIRLLCGSIGFFTIKIRSFVVLCEKYLERALIY